MIDTEEFVKTQYKQFLIAFTLGEQQQYRSVRARTEESAIYQFLQEYPDYDWISPADLEHKQEC